MTDPYWRDDAACLGVDVNAFFPVENTAARRRIHVRAAWECCGTCPVRTECYQDAVRTGEQHGIRGGFDMQEPKVRQWIRDVRAVARASS